MQGKRLPKTCYLWLPGRPAHAMWHAQAGKHGRQCCSLQSVQQYAPLGLRLHTVRCSNGLCGFTGEFGDPQMRRGRLLQVFEVWLPRGQASAMRRAQTRWHGGQCCSWQCYAPLGLRLHTVQCSNGMCGFAGGCGELQMRRGWLPQTSQLWLPRGRASAMRHAQARWHGRQCCSWHCIQQMCPSEAALAQGTMQQLPVWACRRT